MSFYLKYFPIAVLLQLIFSELLTINGYQANIMLIYVILCSMPLGNTSQSTLYGFLVGLFTDFVLFSGSLCWSVEFGFFNLWILGFKNKF